MSSNQFKLNASDKITMQEKILLQMIVFTRGKLLLFFKTIQFVDTVACQTHFKNAIATSIQTVNQGMWFWVGLGTENQFQYGTGSYTTGTYPDQNATQISVLPFGAWADWNK